jgi:hypothetical protein
MLPCKVYANFKTELEVKYQVGIPEVSKPHIKRHRSITNETELLDGDLTGDSVLKLKRANSLNSSKEKKDVPIRIRRDEIMAPTQI